MLYDLAHWLRGALVDPAQNIIQLDKIDNLSQYFTNNDFTITIMLKGARKYRLLEGKLKLQYVILSFIIDYIISPYTKNHYFVFELHQCGLWLHCHGFITMVHRSKTPLLKQKIYFHIENKKLPKGCTYKHRCLIEKVYNVLNWEKYIKKNQPLLTFKPKFKLNKISHINNALTLETQNSNHTSVQTETSPISKERR